MSLQPFNNGTIGADIGRDIGISSLPFGGLFNLGYEVSDTANSQVSNPGFWGTFTDALNSVADIAGNVLPAFNTLLGENNKSATLNEDTYRQAAGNGASGVDNLIFIGGAGLIAYIIFKK